MEKYTEKYTEINEGGAHCTQCPRQCPVEALQCKRGRESYGSGGHEGGHGCSRKGGRGNDRRDCGRNGSGAGDFHGRRGAFGERGRHHGNMDMEPEEELSGLIRSCGHYLFRRGGRKNSQERILHILSHKGEMSQGELQEILQVQPGSISEILTKMEQAGFLFREKDETDRRKTVVKITDSGRETEDLFRERGIEDPFSVLSNEQKEQLKMLLKQLLESWNQNEE